MYISRASYAVSAFILSALILLPSVVLAGSDHYLIDIGFQSNRTLTTGWNNWTETTDQNSTLNLIDHLGATSTATFSLTDKFFIGNNAACTPAAAGATTSSLPYPASATNDQFTVGDFSFQHATCTDMSATIKIAGLDPTNTYEFRMYASRYPGNGANRTAVYTIGSASTTLNADNNLDGYATLSDIEPNGSGEVSLTVAKHSSAAYGYIGILEIIGTPPDAVPVADAGSDVTLTMPDDGVILEGSGEDSDGTIEEYSWSKIYGGTATLTNASSSNLELSDLYPGEYKFRLTVTDDFGNEDTDDVIVYVHTADEPSERPAKTIVVLGSSSAWGWVIENSVAVQSINSWVNLYGRYLDLFNTSNDLVNLGIPGWTTYHVMPDDFVAPDGLPDPEPNANITKALSYDPDAIIINLPSNDSNALYPLEDVEANYEMLADIAEEAGVPLWVTGSAPRDVSQDRRDHLVAIRDWIYEYFGEKSIDVWTDAANPDGTMNPTYSSGDTVHPNEAGYNLIFQRMAEEQIIEQLYAADISDVDASVSGNSATVTWQTSKATGGRVEYGLSVGDMSMTATETATSTTAHSVTITGLSYDTTYYFKVVAPDEVGNEPESDDDSFVVGSAPVVGDPDDEPGRGGSSGSGRKPIKLDRPVLVPPTTSEPIIKTPAPDQGLLPRAGGGLNLPTSVQSLIPQVQTRDLEFNVTGTDVRALQQILNALGFTVSSTGAGSPGFETEYFGALTKAALIKYQQSKGIVPAVGYFGPITRASLGI